MVFPAASYETAVYGLDCTPEVIWLSPETIMEAIAPGTTVTTILPDIGGTQLQVAVIVTVPTRIPVSIVPLKVAVPVLGATVQMYVSVST